MSDLNNSGNMLELFLFEMSSLLEGLDGILLRAEQEQSLTEEDINEIFRVMHTIKGSSAMMEFQAISALTHRLEDCFFFIREHGVEQRHLGRLFDLMLDATDYLKSQFRRMESGASADPENTALMQGADRLYALLRGEEPKESPLGDAPLQEPPAQDAESPSGAFSRYQVNVLFEEDCGMENIRAFMLVNTLQDHCMILQFDPPDIETNPATASQILINGFTLLLESDLDPEELQKLVENALHVKSASVLPALPQEAVSPALPGRYDAVVHFEEDCGAENLRAFLLVNNLRPTCTVIRWYPEEIESDSSTASIILRDGFYLTLETDLSLAMLQETLDHAMYVKSARIAPAGEIPFPRPNPPVEALPAAEDPAAVVPVGEPLPQPLPEHPLQPAAAGPSRPAAHQNRINVSLTKLDDLMNLMGELVIAESMVTRNPDLEGLDAENSLDGFYKAARQLRKLMDELQDLVMSIRMIPILDTFQKMNRVVRDMGRSLGKDAELVMAGETTDLDKAIIDAIADPILHLVRNAMDHGIEPPEERAAAGKPSKAQITLSAQNTGGEILVVISDDGRGLDACSLLQKAQENQLLTKPMEEYTEREAYQLLLLPGFSTKEEVTEYSGRGVGLDVVKKNVEKIGGFATIESESGQGMSVLLKIPLTLAIVEGMELAVGNRTYTLPITSINEAFRAAPGQVFSDTEGHEMIQLRGSVYPVIRLHELYGVPDGMCNLEDGILIWVQSGERAACLFADRLIGERQIVVKSLPAYLNRYPVKHLGISGCTILGDGTIGLILDAGSIIDAVMGP